METVHDPRVPRDRLNAAEREARRRFPHAQRIKALWTPANDNDVTVEVWDADGRAQTGALS